MTIGSLDEIVNLDSAQNAKCPSNEKITETVSESLLLLNNLNMSNFSTPQELFDFMMRNRERISEQLRKNMENFPLALYDLSTYGWYFGYGSSYGEVLNY